MEALGKAEEGGEALTVGRQYRTTRKEEFPASRQQTGAAKEITTPAIIRLSALFPEPKAQVFISPTKGECLAGVG